MSTESLTTRVYRELRRIAARVMATERSQTLQPTAVVHEAWLRLAGAERTEPGSGAFVATAARAIRRVLVDHARRRQRECRGGGRWQRVPLDRVEPAAVPDTTTLVALDEALGTLAAEDPLKARIVELRFFAGLDLDETADALGVSRSTVSREWRFARAWLRNAIGEGGR